ncbi:MAG: hypothetical protein A3E38_00360 [Candidatus Moranbacteria bacterium RIFCSPHIGHO2_12_FULL_54_9]|nr:MAG: hypothetical protein A2878_00720 [Candidatus Moranbacteria bacterium RIFCSPHIGHO2_01_FULL_54_31]OGI26189.1 MAG: hypothetical protein A3E38_00360 [Candidatus Moranbacteria bacterium RIFCSPHIGHO2_12_FULL_54_9]
MTQKQLIGLVVGVLVLGAVFVYVYQQFSRTASRDAMLQKSAVTPSAKQEEQAALPTSIDDISRSIAGEIDADLSALDAEENGETAEIQADSESVNNLGTSYDENSL